MSQRRDPPFRLDPAGLARLAGELREKLRDGLLSRVTAPAGFPEDLLLFLEGPGAGRGPVLRVALAPGRARLHREARPTPLAEAPALVRGLSTRLCGRKLLDLHGLPGERIVRLVFGPGPDQVEPASLLLELFPPGAWLLLDGSQRIVLASRRGVASRRFEPGSPWPPPAPRPAAPGLAAAQEEPSGALEEAVADWFGRQDAALLAEAEARQREKALLQAETRARARVAALEAQAAEADGAAGLRRQAELLKANLRRIQPGQSFLEAEDFYQPDLPLIRIPLDPARNVRHQMQALFHRARRLDRGRTVIEARLIQARSLVARVQQARAALAAGDSWEELEPDLVLLRRERLLSWPAASAPARPTEPAAPRERFRRFVSREGLTILVGKDRRQNDLLTLRVARGNDLWLHAGGGLAGSHVVVRLPRGKVASPETLLDAGHLALYYSQARGRPRAEVLWTQRKWVRKPKGLPAGQVRVDRSRTLLVDLDADLLARLLATAGEEES